MALFCLQGPCLCEDTCLMSAPSSLSAAASCALPSSRAGLSLHSATHCTYPRQTSSSHLSAAHSHYRVHALYSTYPGGRSPIGSLSLFAHFDELLILFDLGNRHSNKIHTSTPSTKSRQRTPNRSFGRKWKILADFHCPVPWQELLHTVIWLQAHRAF